MFQSCEHELCHFGDPRDSADVWWVTVTLPEEMSENSHTDGEIMNQVVRLIAQSDVEMGEEALHGQGQRCISFPTKRVARPDTETLLMTEFLVSWWWGMISENKVKLDQYMIFTAQDGVVDVPLMEVPSNWKKPDLETEFANLA